MNHWGKIANKIKNAAKEPGVYIFYDKRAPIYVGKASNLRSRLRSYLAPGDFNPAPFDNSLQSKRCGVKNARLQESATRLELLPLRSEIEALLKESELIKKFDPPYNVLWRDDKSYFYVVFTKEKCPRIFISHKNLLNSRFQILDSNFIGPFTEGRALRLVLRMLRRRFPYCTCPQPHLRTCLNAQIGNCFGFCCRAQRSESAKSGKKGARPNREQVKQYQKNIRTIKNFLLGKPLKTFGKDLKPEEKDALEKILAHREFLENFDSPANTSYLAPATRYLIEGYDISHLSGREVVSGMTAWSLNGEKLAPRKDFWRKFIIRTAKPADDPAAMRETVHRRLNHPEWPYPNIMIIDGGISQFRAAKQAVQEAGLDARISVRSFAKPEQLVYGVAEKPIPLDQASRELKKIIPEVIADTHNFAVRFHRARRKKAFLNPEEIMLDLKQ